MCTKNGSSILDMRYMYWLLNVSMLMCVSAHECFWDITGLFLFQFSLCSWSSEVHATVEQHISTNSENITTGTSLSPSSTSKGFNVQFYTLNLNLPVLKFEFFAICWLVAWCCTSPACYFILPPHYTLHWGKMDMMLEYCLIGEFFEEGIFITWLVWWLYQFLVTFSHFSLIAHHFYASTSIRLHQVVLKKDSASLMLNRFLLSSFFSFNFMSLSSSKISGRRYGSYYASDL